MVFTDNNGLPKGAYSKDSSQHLLSRSVPIISNRPVRIPEIVARNFKPRKSAAEFQRELQEKVAKKLEVQFGIRAKHDPNFKPEAEGARLHSFNSIRHFVYCRNI
jgi:hypothetical protein